MPYVWKDPDVLLDLGETKVFYTYRYNMANEPSQFLYTFDQTDTDSKDEYNDSLFDVRDFFPEAGWDRTEHAAAIKRAIESGELVPPGTE